MVCGPESAAAGNVRNYHVVVRILTLESHGTEEAGAGEVLKEGADAIEDKG